MRKSGITSWFGNRMNGSPFHRPDGVPPLDEGREQPKLESFSCRRDEKQMAGIRVRENEPFEMAVKRFRKKCEKAGILTELRRRERYEKPSVKRKKKALAAKKRTLKRLRKQGLAKPLRGRIFFISASVADFA